MALPARILKRLKLTRVGRVDYKLANGNIVTLDQWLSKVRIGKREEEALFIMGDSLLGMDIMEDVGRKLILDFARQTVRLEVALGPERGRS